MARSFDIFKLILLGVLLISVISCDKKSPTPQPQPTPLPQPLPEPEPDEDPYVVIQEEIYVIDDGEDQDDGYYIECDNDFTTQLAQCPYCYNGSGVCSSCVGTGYNYVCDKICSVCNGTGICGWCKGTGTVRQDINSGMTMPN